MNNKFDLERFKAGEPAYDSCNEYYFVGFSKFTADYPVIAERDGRVVRVKESGYFHGDYACLTMKSTLKKVDLSKLPVDTVCQVNGILKHFATLSSSNVPLFYENGCSSDTVVNNRSNGISNAEISIYDKQPWTVWRGGECPIPDGLEYEVIILDADMTRVVEIGHNSYWGNDSTIIAYRLTGVVLEGWEL